MSTDLFTRMAARALGQAAVVRPAAPAAAPEAADAIAEPPEEVRPAALAEDLAAAQGAPPAPASAATANVAKMGRHGDVAARSQQQVERMPLVTSSFASQPTNAKRAAMQGEVVVPDASQSAAWSPPVPPEEPIASAEGLRPLVAQQALVGEPAVQHRDMAAVSADAAPVREDAQDRPTTRTPDEQGQVELRPLVDARRASAAEQPAREPQRRSDVLSGEAAAGEGEAERAALRPAPREARRLPAAEEPVAQAPSIQITIGRIDVRALQPLEKPAPRTRPERARPALSLDDYLKRRGERRR